MMTLPKVVLVTFAMMLAASATTHVAGSSIYDGTWTGTTSQQKAISFTVVNDGIKSYTVGYPGGTCTENIISAGGIFSSPHPITGNSFSLEGVVQLFPSRTILVNMTGTFNTETSASGNLQFTKTGCGSATWNASKTSGPGDTTPPTAPTGLTATAVSSSQINLSWSASTDNVGVTQYKIYRGGSLLTTLTGTPPVTSFSNTGLTASTRYSYTVQACDAMLNCSAQSTAVSATTLAAAQPAADYTGAWYNAGEPGWGLSIIRGPISGLYGIIMYHYNQSASPTWYWMSGGSFSGNTYSVPVSLYSGPYFGGPFNPALVTSSVVGSATINFTSATTATISYTISGITVTKNIAKLDF